MNKIIQWLLETEEWYHYQEILALIAVLLMGGVIIYLKRFQEKEVKK